MTLKEIKSATARGIKVHWASQAYYVIYNITGQYLITCPSTGYTIGLTWCDGVTINGKEEDFFISTPFSCN